MKKLFMLVPFALSLCACSNTDVCESDETPAMKLYAEVGRTIKSKTVTDDTGASSFVKDDCVGMFVYGSNEVWSWTFDGNASWTSDSGAEWENKNDKFDFCAYYPFSSEATPQEGIRMPDLSSQSGKLSDIGSKDFLVARCLSSYADNAGVVTFSGDNSFRHVYSLLHLYIERGVGNSDALITGCRFNGEGIVTNHNYVFGSTSAQDHITPVASSEGSALEITCETAVSGTDKYEVVVLLNAVSLDMPLEFSLLYEKDGVPYVAKASLKKEYSKGSYHKTKLNWVKNELTVSGNEVQNWNVINTEDILLQSAALGY